jgi:SAM-dependent methyltransferase
MTADPSFLRDVKTYYDKNTKRFARHHDSGVVDALHRGVWAPEVTTQEEAFQYVNRLLLQEIEGLTCRFATPLRVLDLGCGVGGSLFYLAQHLSVEATGVTLSPVQVELANERARALQVERQCRFIEADFLHLPDLESHPAVFAIESFVHCPDAAQFFTVASSVMPSGGRLILCDDVLTSPADTHLPPKARRYLSDFQRGWHLRSLIATPHIQALATNAGLTLIDNRDLTPYLALQSRWDRFIALCVRLGHWLPLRAPWWLNWVGGNGAQMCLLAGVTTYRFLVFEKE